MGDIQGIWAILTAENKNLYLLGAKVINPFKLYA